MAVHTGRCGKDVESRCITCGEIGPETAENGLTTGFGDCGKLCGKRGKQCGKRGKRIPDAGRTEKNTVPEDTGAAF